MPDLSEGIVTKTAGSTYWVWMQNQFYCCTLAGKVRLEGIKATNPVAVGDKVVFDAEKKTIIDILPRKNYILREAANLSRRIQILAANLDLLALIVSYKLPRTSKGFADRVLATCEAYSVSPLIIFNKHDLWDQEDQTAVEEWKQVYESLGYRTLISSIYNEISIQELSKHLIGKTTLFIGHSGAGKSSLLNKLIPGLGLRTADISRKFGKGRHTTTFAEMFITEQFRVIDTPGVKEFGMARMKKAEVGDYFPEILKIKHLCRYNNCLHVNEPGCAVLEAVKEGKIATWRYENYLNILHSCQYEAWRDE
ncbi:MAG: ribosome small subunit-dependent GTPase A [Flavobacteriales bacterium]|nr:ribosome small subunit-dependent GTPase A [Flavobacteriales bacterium]MCX7768554.1 ribosome small subunit-dependent GTPase A [Flavobacteriales bacterium]MDW8409477.1 ribosome small subunit-dependent GTPase A [Flavobacteriales bacterium]